MGKFMHESLKTPGDGSTLPLGKRLKKWFYNLRVGLTQDKASEHGVISQFGKRRK